MEQSSVQIQKTNHIENVKLGLLNSFRVHNKLAKNLHISILHVLIPLLYDNYRSYSQTKRRQFGSPIFQEIDGFYSFFCLQLQKYTRLKLKCTFFLYMPVLSVQQLYSVCNPTTRFGNKFPSSGVDDFHSHVSGLKLKVENFACTFTSHTLRQCYSTDLHITGKTIFQ